MRLSRLFFGVILSAVAASVFAHSANAGLGPVPLPFEVRVLYDNSGSMYPGYRLNSPLPKGQARQFYEYPEFKEFLYRLISAQKDNDAAFLSLWAFTELNRVCIAPKKPIHLFDPAKDFAGMPKPPGQRTYLTENLNAFVKDFEGLVLLVTDNIIDTHEGTADNRDVRAFFEFLDSNPAIKSVHVFKYPFSADGLSSNLSIYFILVSNRDFTPDEREKDLAPFDERVGKFLSVFPAGSSFLKLKDLSVGMVKLKTDPVKVKVTEVGEDIFGEHKKVSLDLSGIIESQLTQHRIIQGSYSVATTDDFLPVNTTRKVDVRPIPRSNFTPVKAMPLNEIEPSGSQPISVSISSNIPVSISTVGLAGWLKAAFGLGVCYGGMVEVRLENVRVRLNEDRLTGIWGIEHAAEVFNFDREQEITNINPGSSYVDFCLETGSGKGFMLVFSFLAFVACVLFAARLLMGGRKAVFIVKKPDGDQIVSLGLFGSAPVDYRGKIIGVAARNTGKDAVFKASRLVTAVLEPDGSWLVTPLDATPPFRLSIERDYGAASGGEGNFLRTPESFQGRGGGYNPGGGPPSVPLPP